MAEVTEAMLDAAAEVFGTYDVPRDWLRNALEAAQTAAPDPVVPAVDAGCAGGTAGTGASRAAVRGRGICERFAGDRSKANGGKMHT